MIIVLMGVSGSGKTTVGTELARQLSWTFVDADDFHPTANVEKMHRGIPLNDEDRRPWLAAIHQRLLEAAHNGESVVLACSALKHAYQEYLQHEEPERIHYVYLQGSEELIHRAARCPKGALHESEPVAQPVRDAGTSRKRHLGRYCSSTRRNRRRDPPQARKCSRVDRAKRIGRPKQGRDSQGVAEMVAGGIEYRQPMRPLLRKKPRC